MFLIDLTDLKTGERVVYNLANMGALRSYGDEKKNTAITFPSGYTEFVKESVQDIMAEVARSLRPSAPMLPPGMPPGMNFK